MSELREVGSYFVESGIPFTSSTTAISKVHVVWRVVRYVDTVDAFMQPTVGMEVEQIARFEDSPSPYIYEFGSETENA